MGSVLCKRDSREVSFLFGPERTQQEMAGCEPGRGTSPDTESSKALILDFPGSRTLRNKLYFSINLPNLQILLCACVCVCAHVCISFQLCLTLCHPLGCNPPGFSVLNSHGILQARMLEWVAIPFSRGSSQPRDQTWVSCIVGTFTSEPPGKPQILLQQPKWNHTMSFNLFNISPFRVALQKISHNCGSTGHCSGF